MFESVLGQPQMQLQLFFTRGHRSQDHRTGWVEGTAGGCRSHCVMVVAELSLGEMIAVSRSSAVLGWHGA